MGFCLTTRSHWLSLVALYSLNSEMRLEEVTYSWHWYSLSEELASGVGKWGSCHSDSSVFVSANSHCWLMYFGPAFLHHTISLPCQPIILLYHHSGRFPGKQENSQTHSHIDCNQIWSLDFVGILKRIRISIRVTSHQFDRAYSILVSIQNTKCINSLKIFTIQQKICKIPGVPKSTSIWKITKMGLHSRSANSFFCPLDQGSKCFLKQLILQLV